MKCTSFITLLTGLAALCLQFIALFGGYNTTTLPNLYMFQVNVTKIANTEFNTTHGNGCNCIEWVNGTLTINGTNNHNDHNTHENSQSNIKLPLNQFYNSYVMNYCGGEYLNGSNDPVLTNCQNPSPTHRFVLNDVVTQALEKVEKQLNESLSLNDLKWPDGITDAFIYVKQAYTAMVFFFVISLTCVLIAVISGSVGIFSTHRFTHIVLIMSTALAFFCLLVSAGLSTAINATVVNNITADGDQVGISANSGSWFLAVSWIAVSVLFISTLSAIAEACTGGARHGPKRKGYKRSRSPGSGYMIPSMMAPAPAPMMPQPNPFSNAFQNPFASFTNPASGWSGPTMMHPGYHQYHDPYASRHSLLRPMSDYDDEDFR